MQPKQILLVHQSLRSPGGANMVAAWVVEALKDEYALTILTWDSIDTTELNRFYGTSLREGDFRVILPPWPVKMLRRIDPDDGSLLPSAYLMRTCRRIRDRYDLVIGAQMEELDLGAPALLYVHYPGLGRFWGRYRDSGGRPLLTQLRDALRGRTRPWMVLSGFSVDRLKRHTVLTNSDWTGAKMESIYGVRGQTLYPPVPAAGAACAWANRANSFVAAGRFNRHKRLEIIVRVLGRVRQQVPGVRLHLVGSRERVGGGLAYYRELQRLAAANAEWVTLHEDLSRSKLSELIGSVRYGIHAQVDEHFGIAPAEMLLAGCIPFVHASGGQVEITDSDPRLCFTTEDDAVRKITTVIEDEDLQRTILRKLEPRRELFTCHRFVEGFREAVRSLVAG